MSNALTLVRCACEGARVLNSLEARQTAAHAIHGAVADCTRRTRELLRSSRPHASLPVRIELHSELSARAESLKQGVRSNIDCTFELAPAGTVLVPPSWLPQIVTNLLLNAAGAIHGSGSIKVSTKSVEFTETSSIIDRLPLEFMQPSKLLTMARA